MLGICYGMQLMARDLGGTLVPLAHREYGPAMLVVDARESPLLGRRSVPNRAYGCRTATASRSVPAGFRPLAHTERCAVAAIGDERRRIYGVQFHPEVVHTEAGKTVLENFLHRDRGHPPDWKMESFVERSDR